ncbi:hypothetical protein SAMN04488519_112144 [Algoriphagus ornithinivorans]|uniref:Uncharacterized protein n=1 Tax=Algoriphagus ornithinivorans TaxID=226506 RepID=A0A1I5JJZ5_9BACT|nr:hypothetical protein SAMN04488519_112144 [Algoriphagus ornithinivorans]
MKALSVIIVISGLILIIYIFLYFLEIVNFNNWFYAISILSLFLKFIYSFLKKGKETSN